MPLTVRIVYTAISVIALMADYILYSRVLLPLNQLVQNKYSGPFSSVTESLVGFVPLVIGVMLLGVILFQIWGTVKEEKARNVRRLDRPPRGPPK